MTDGLLGARRLRELLERNGVRPDKALGQNFVIDPNTIRMVVASAGVGPQMDVLEIGAGAGSLTVGLAAECRRVVAIEFDRRLIPVLEEVISEWPNVKLIEADVLDFDLSGVEAQSLVGNLPYNIATLVVMRVLETAPQITEMTVMTQREVGERLVAGPGSKTYGGPTVLVAHWSDAKIVGRVSRNAFWPVPGVDSVIVRFVRKPEVPPVAYADLQRVVRAAFSQRRKTLRNTLAQIFGTAVEAERMLAAVGVDPTARAEDLEPADFLKIARALLPD